MFLADEPHLDVFGKADAVLGDGCKFVLWAGVLQRVVLDIFDLVIDVLVYEELELVLSVHICL